MSNDTFIREVDEELRGERMRTLWKRFGPFIIGAAVAVVLVVAVNEGWNWWQRSTAAQAADQFYAALELAEGGNAEGARAALEDIASSGNGGYATLARFRQAGLLASAGERQEAIAAYDALATSETNPRLRELALVMAAYLLVDDADVQAVNQRVGGLAVEGNPMRNAAREAIGLAQYAAGDAAAAHATFEQIVNDPLVDSDMRGRAQVYASQLVALGAADDETVAARAAALGTAGEEELFVAPFDGDMPVVELPFDLVAPTETPAPTLESAPEAEPAPEAARADPTADATNEPVPEVSADGAEATDEDAVAPTN